MTALVASIVVLAGALVFLLVSRAFRGVPRLRLLRLGIYLGVPSFTASLVLLPIEFEATFADALSVAGLGLSLVLGVGAKALDLMSLRLRVGVVIPSRVPFHTELRRGLTEGMLSVRADVSDDYLSSHRAIEDLSAFLPCLRRTLERNPDYLVIACPSFAMLETPEILKRLRSFQRRGGQLVFIDNAPSDAVHAELRAYGLVRADVERAAELISDWVAQQSTTARVHVVSGPATSDPAQRYRRAFESRMPTEQITVMDTSGWTEKAAYLAIRSMTGQAPPDFIVCGNDVMAFGAVRAVRENEVDDDRWARAGVIGYNGISRALFAIAEPENPLLATVCIPPSTYGHEIAMMILADARRWFRRSDLDEVCIPFSEGQLIDVTNIDLVLEG
jgi:DNA-binding LacI/PurR family transcriptional regulator